MPNLVTVSPEDYPIKKKESWWVVHPNNGNVEFSAPVGAITLCREGFLSFKKGTVYSITSNNEQTGHITLTNKEDVVKMPYYVFARFFDAEAFVRPIKPIVSEHKRMGPQPPIQFKFEG